MKDVLISEGARHILLMCGVAAAVLTVATDLIMGHLTANYRFLSQSISLLGASGAPTRRFVLPLNLAGNLLLIAFSAGLWLTPSAHWALRLTAGLIAGSAILASVAAIFFPLHPDRSFQDSPNNLNVIVMGTSVLFFFLAIVFSAVAHQNWFRYFSLGLLLLFLIEDILATRGTRPSLGGSTGPLVRLQERTMVYGEMLWVIMQAWLLF